MNNILFYKYVEINDLEDFRQEVLDFCNSLGLKGKILVASEGVNGCLSGTVGNTNAFKDFMHKDHRFSDLEFKDGVVEEHTFRKMHVKIKKEIITSNFDGDIKNKAPYIEPSELKALLDKKEEIVLIDVRNDYESKEGKFKDAIAPNIKVFSEWPKAVKELKDLKDKQIVTYCTGGVRCEKASAYMVQKGFKNVRQLHGGIIKYGKEFGNEHWEGKCFVFDKRVLIDIDPEQGPSCNASLEMQKIGYNC